ncbi:protein IMPACT-B-like [Coccinella septempunctata]|uniref:protein IMPACT-B-like n=1 Tax=Coccinella septempunctata TaxID=41139 RepID=UPI001D066A25|nr:protein IMPACT-B-like [Coccinella septempunctata]XP_044765518.1 protein IMPACT-B-like [Coccinella septempunctata]XP_044766372.1 protein IMPACT-B-like [Coccinella septempunctata]XP_044767193.1 protein IMPACT-B-like [Coccinella septempunctata]
METDNISQQVEEVEVLKSIYENEWIAEDGNESFIMKISPSVKLFITLHIDYPSEKPPKFELMAPELSADEKIKLYKEFKTIYEESMGSPILYQWIEKLKEYTIFKPKNINEKKKAKRQKNKPNNGFERFSKQVVHGPIIEDRKSVFQGHVCAVSSEAEVKNFIEFLMENKKIAQAKHNIYAYRIFKNSSILQDCDDDGENHASKRVLHLLQLLNVENVIVVVSRWYGGIQLGPDRFKHIKNAARRALVQAGYVK